MKLLFILIFIFNCKPNNKEMKEGLHPDSKTNYSTSDSKPSSNTDSATNSVRDTDNYCSSGGEMFVTADRGLRVREKPDLNSKSLGTVLKGQTVDFISIEKEEVEVDGQIANFFKVNTPFGEGYVYSGYLEYIKNNEGKICGYKTEQVFSPNSVNYYLEVIPLEGYSTGSIYRFYNYSNHSLINIYDPKSGEYLESKGWENENEVLFEWNYGDDGCSWKSKYLINIHTLAERKISGKSNCN